LAKAAINIVRNLNFPFGSLRQAAKRYLPFLTDNAPLIIPYKYATTIDFEPDAED
jgi:hypothetical protein